MPCYLFTLHGRQTWTPDHKRGYVRRGQGILPSDRKAAEEYARRARHPKIEFDQAAQQVIIDALIEAAAHQRYHLHAVFFETTHVHFLVSWRIERGWLRVRANLRESMTHRLNERFGKHEWFSAGGSRRQVKDRQHFDYLITDYRRKHHGLFFVDSPPHPK